MNEFILSLLYVIAALLLILCVIIVLGTIVATCMFFVDAIKSNLKDNDENQEE